MRRHDAYVWLMRSTVFVFAIAFGWSSFALAEEPTSPPAPSDQSVQERAVTPLAANALRTFISLTPTHGPSGTPVFIRFCGFLAADLKKLGTISVGGTLVFRMRLDDSCGPSSGSGWGGETRPQIIDFQGPPGPVPVRLDVPGSSHPVETINFTIDPGPPITWNPRFMLVLRGQGVLDKETSLVWQRVPTETASLTGVCWPTGDRLSWRIPSGEELASLLDPMNESPALPTGHPFLLKNSALEVWTSDHPVTLEANSLGWTEYTWNKTVNLQNATGRGVYQSMRWSTPLGTPFKQERLNLTFAAASWCVRGPVSGPIP